jgi:hypothetical protein
MTFAKSHSKQAYHDARKASWGDIFPHSPKGKEVVRDRGIRRLTPATPDLGGLQPENEDSTSWPTAELSGSVDLPEDAATSAETSASGSSTMTWDFGVQRERPKRGTRFDKAAIGPTGRASRKRSLHTSAVVQSVHPDPESPPFNSKLHWTGQEADEQASHLPAPR